MGEAQPDHVYTGTDNLEVMLEARRYNRFLTNQVLRHRVGAGPALDFGAGIGTFAEMVSSSGLPVDCLEVDPAQCALLAARGFRVFNTPAAIATHSYDYVFSLNVLEHIEDDVAALRECARILRPGGVVFLYVPAFPSLYGDMDRKVGHFRRYTRATLESACTGAGLRVARSGYVDFAGYFASLLYNAMSTGTGDINRRAVSLYDRLVFPLSRLADRIAHPFLGKNVFAVAIRP